ncbi:MAG: hypothetical protein LBI02_04490 [Opitutaceae bacterium]|nr:hypothetical protein [Opitutaceae bacterium]
MPALHDKREKGFENDGTGQEIGCDKNTTSGQFHAAKLVHQIANTPGSKLAWHKARLDCFALLVGAVLVRRTVNLPLLSACSHRGMTRSAYRCFQRFLGGFALSALEVGRFILGCRFRRQEGFVPVMARSIWQLGRTLINLLFVGVVLGGMSLPITWSAPHKRTKTDCLGLPARIRLLTEITRCLGRSADL